MNVGPEMENFADKRMNFPSNPTSTKQNQITNIIHLVDQNQMNNIMLLLLDKLCNQKLHKKI